MQVNDVPERNRGLVPLLARHCRPGMLVLLQGVHGYYDPSVLTSLLKEGTGADRVDTVECQGADLEVPSDDRIALIDARGRAEALVVHGDAMHRCLMVLCDRALQVERTPACSRASRVTLNLNEMRFERAEVRRMLVECGLDAEQTDDLCRITGCDAAFVLLARARYAYGNTLDLMRLERDLVQYMQDRLARCLDADQLAMCSALCHLSGFSPDDLACGSGQKDQCLEVVRILENEGLIWRSDCRTYGRSDLLRLALEDQLDRRGMQEAKRKGAEYAFSRLIARGAFEEALAFAVSCQEVERASRALKGMLDRLECLRDAEKMIRCHALVPPAWYTYDANFRLLHMVRFRYLGSGTGQLTQASALAEDVIDGRAGGRLSTGAAAALVVSTLLEHGHAQDATRFLESWTPTPDDDRMIYHMHVVLTCFVQNMQGRTGGKPGFLRAKRRLMGVRQGELWMSLMDLLMPFDPFLLLLSHDDCQRSLDRYLRREDNTSREQVVLHQIFRHILDIRQSRRPQASAAPEGSLQRIIEASESDQLKQWGNYMLALAHLCGEEPNMASGYVEEAIYHSKINDQPLLRLRSYLLASRIALRAKRPLQAAGFLQQARDMGLVDELVVFGWALQREEAMVAAANGDCDEARAGMRLYRQTMFDAGSEEGYLAASVHLAAMELQAQGEEDVKRSVADDILSQAAAFAAQHTQESYLNHCLSCEPSLRDRLDCATQGRDVGADSDEPDFEIRLFGESSVRCKGQVILDEDWPTRKVKGLFQYMVLYADRRHAREELARSFWPDVESRAQVLSNLRVALSLLGKTLEAAGMASVLHRTRQRTWIELPEGVRIDASVARQDYEEGKRYYRQKRFEPAGTHLRRALTVLEQPFLSMQNKDPWAIREKRIMRKRTEKCQYLLLHMAIEAQQYAKAVVYCRKMLEHNCYREDIHRILIKILKQQGRCGEALGAYREYKRLLREDLKVEPSQDMLAMERKLSKMAY